MSAVGKVENPQHSHVRSHGTLVPSNGAAIEPALSELRFAFRQCVDIDVIVFNYVDNFGYQAIRFGKMIWSNKIEIVRRRVILRNFSKLTALQKSNGQIETR
jgi:hypothetical protein